MELMLTDKLFIDDEVGLLYTSRRTELFQNGAIVAFSQRLMVHA
jgi:hypothetical protein